jgi:hypothetical protein
VEFVAVATTSHRHSVFWLRGFYCYLIFVTWWFVIGVFSAPFWGLLIPWSFFVVAFVMSYVARVGFLTQFCVFPFDQYKSLQGSV